MHITIPDDVLTGEHALLSPSSAKRWINCPASPQRSMGLTDVPTMPSMVGTAAHWVLEYALALDMDPYDFINSTAPNGIDIDGEICDNVRIAIDWVHEHVGPKDQLILESRVDIYKALDIRDNDGVLLPVIYGTADIRILHSDGGLTVADYKNGIWGVSVKKNPQLELYALGALQELNYNAVYVRLVIIQPRNGGIKTLMTTVEQLLSKELIYAVSADVTLDENPEAVASADSCKFCLAKHTCPENWEYRNKAIMDLLL